MDINLAKITTKQLLLYYSQIIEELRLRKIIRTSNGPVGDYAEWLVAEKLCLTLASNSTTGYDAIDSNGAKYQIKGRRITSHNHSTQLSAIRNLETYDFDFLIVVIFNEMFEPIIVLKIPHSIIGKYARFSTHVNAHLLRIRENIINDPNIENITSLFTNF